MAAKRPGGVAEETLGLPNSKPTGVRGRCDDPYLKAHRQTWGWRTAFATPPDPSGHPPLNGPQGGGGRRRYYPFGLIVDVLPCPLARLQLQLARMQDRLGVAIRLDAALEDEVAGGVEGDGIVEAKPLSPPSPAAIGVNRKQEICPSPAGRERPGPKELDSLTLRSLIAIASHFGGSYLTGIMRWA